MSAAHAGEDGTRLTERAAGKRSRAEATGPAGERDRNGERPITIIYATTDSPFGRLLVAVADSGLVAIGLPAAPFGQLLEWLEKNVAPRVEERPTGVESVRRQLDEYFSGKRRQFDLSLDLGHMNGFKRRVLDRMAAIPYGHIATYGEIAAEAGAPRAYRAAGSACAANPIPIVIPCHRVVASGGGIGGYGGGPEMKRALLELEGSS